MKKLLAFLCLMSFAAHAQDGTGGGLAPGDVVTIPPGITAGIDRIVTNENGTLYCVVWLDANDAPVERCLVGRLLTPKP